MEVRSVNLKDYTSLHIGGEANMVTIKSESELVEAIHYAKENNLNIYVLGHGTNTVFKDNLKNILIIKIEITGKNFELIDGDVLLKVPAGEVWDEVVKYAVENGWWGIENLSLIPGTAGAAPVQNIGAYGVELCNVLNSVRVFDTNQNIFVDLSNSDCKFGYRDSIFKQNKNRYVIVSVVLRLNTKSKPILTYKPLDLLLNKENLTIREIRELVVTTRQAKLPDYHVFPNAGSFFKNSIIEKDVLENLKKKYVDVPAHEQDGKYKIPTAWLIENAAKMKGVRVGELGTWLNQPLVIVNYGISTYGELVNFSNIIIDKIYNETGIKIEMEVNIVG